MNADKLPRYLILIRWGTFRLDLVGRIQIIAVVTVVAATIGLKLLVF